MSLLFCLIHWVYYLYILKIHGITENILIIEIACVLVYRYNINIGYKFNEKFRDLLN